MTSMSANANRITCYCCIHVTILLAGRNHTEFTQNYLMLQQQCGPMPDTTMDLIVARKFSGYTGQRSHTGKLARKGWVGEGTSVTTSSVQHPKQKWSCIHKHPDGQCWHSISWERELLPAPMTVSLQKAATAAAAVLFRLCVFQLCLTQGEKPFITSFE